MFTLGVIYFVVRKETKFVIVPSLILKYPLNDSFQAFQYNLLS